MELTRLELRIVLTDPIALLIPIVAPLLFLPFLAPSLRVAAGGGDVSGAELGVPMVAVLFGFLTINDVSMAVYREHGWRTWDRLRGVGLSKWEIAIGKVAVPAGVAILQLFVLLVAAQLVFSQQVLDRIGPLLLPMAAVLLVPLGLAMLVTTTMPSAPAANAVGVLVLLLLIGIGGGFAPVEILPGWSQTLADLSPTRWLVDAFAVTLESGELSGGSAVRAAGAAGFGVVTFVAGVLRMRLGEHKQMWS